MNPPIPCRTLGELAYRHLPVLKFDESERSFPIRAESWLTHVSSAPWVAQHVTRPAGGRQVSVTPSRTEPRQDFAVDTWRRGTAILRSSPLEDGLPLARVPLPGAEHLGGAPNSSGRPIQLSDNPQDPDAIGNPRHRAQAADVFLSFGGWDPDSNGGAGDPEYLYQAFSELSAIMNPHNCAWQPIALRENMPHIWQPQPPSPTVYAEATWAADYLAVSADARRRDLPPQVPGLERYLVLTYHLLYPQREPGPGGQTRMEGQWEAISVYLPARKNPRDLTEPSPDDFDSPSYVVASQGPEATSDGYLGDARRLDTGQVKVDNGHVEVYVLPGAHGNAFTAPDGSIWTKPTPGTGGLATPAPSPVPGTGGVVAGFFEIAGWPHQVIGEGQGDLPDWWPPDPLLALIIGLFNELFGDHDDGYGGNPNPNAHPQLPGEGTGPQVNPPEPGEAPDSELSSDPAASNYTNAGNRQGKDVVSYDIAVINNTGGDDQDCAPPPWWGFPGRWGIAISPRTASTWRSGSRRVDDEGKSLGYWNTHTLLTAGGVWNG